MKNVFIVIGVAVALLILVGLFRGIVALVTYITAPDETASNTISEELQELDVASGDTLSLQLEKLALEAKTEEEKRDEEILDFINNKPNGWEESVADFLEGDSILVYYNNVKQGVFGTDFVNRRLDSLPPIENIRFEDEGYPMELWLISNFELVVNSDETTICDNKSLVQDARETIRDFVGYIQLIFSAKDSDDQKKWAEKAIKLFENNESKIEIIESYKTQSKRSFTVKEYLFEYIIKKADEPFKFEVEAFDVSVIDQIVKTEDGKWRGKAILYQVYSKTQSGGGLDNVSPVIYKDKTTKEVEILLERVSCLDENSEYLVEGCCDVKLGNITAVEAQKMDI